MSNKYNQIKIAKTYHKKSLLLSSMEPLTTIQY